MKKINENIFNPALMFGIGLFPLLIVGTSLAAGLIFGALIMGVLIVSNLLYYAFKPIILENVRIPIYAMIVFASVYFLDSLISELMVKSYDNIHELITVLFAASIVFYALEKNKDEEKLKNGFMNSVLLGIGYFMSLIVVGLLREFLGKGTILEKTVIDGFNGLPFFSGVVGGLLVILVYALIYNTISYFIKKRVKMTKSLAERYELYLSLNTSSELIEGEEPEMQEPQKLVEPQEDEEKLAETNGEEGE